MDLREFHKLSGELQWRYGVSRHFNGFQGISEGFQEALRAFRRASGSFQGISRCYKVFQGVSRSYKTFQSISGGFTFLNRLTGELQESFKGVSRRFRFKPRFLTFQTDFAYSFDDL